MPWPISEQIQIKVMKYGIACEGLPTRRRWATTATTPGSAFCAQTEKVVGRQEDGRRADGDVLAREFQLGGCQST